MVNWAAWGHPEIRSMLDTTVDPSDIHDGVRAWREQGRNTTDVLTRLTRELNEIVSGGWRGAAADRAITALDPINQWSAGQADTTELTTALMDASGFCAGQAKAVVPPPKSYDLGESLRSFASGGMAGLVNDVVAQEQQHAEAHAEAVRIMTNVYSAPINDYRAAVPTYPQLVDPTLQPPEQPPKPGPAPGPGYPGGEAPGGGAGTHGGGHVAHTPSAHTAHTPSAPTAHPQPAPVALQSVTSGVPVPHSGGQVASDQGTHGPPHVGGQVGAAAVAAAAAAAAGIPVMGQIAGDARRARAASGGVRLGGGEVGGYPGGGGQVSGGGRAGAGHPAEFGPRPSAVAEESRMGAGPGRGATGMGAGRANPGEMMAPMGGGRGPGGEDSEHRRPSYLIEMDDIFTDGRKVAPAVIGENLTEQDD
jgi:hypothetical protein